MKKSVAAAIHSYLFGKHNCVKYSDDAGTEKMFVIPQAKGYEVISPHLILYHNIFAAILIDINKKFKYRHNTEYRLLNELRLGEDVEIESPRRLLLTSISRNCRGRPHKEHEDWLRSHGKTLSFTDHDGRGGEGVAVSISPPRLFRKGDRIALIVVVHVSLIVCVSTM